MLLAVLLPAGCSAPAPPRQQQTVPIAQERGNVSISKEMALRLALAALRHRSGNDPWYTLKHAGAGLLQEGDRRFWSVSCSASPIAGGGGRAKVDADTGEVFDVQIPVGTR